MEIISANRHFRTERLEQYAFGKLREMAARVGARVPPLTEISDATPLKARVNHGRWSVGCPCCNASSYVWMDKPLVLCGGCFNGDCGNKWRRVEMPANWREIEQVLKARPDPRTRGWEPMETIEDLIEENRQHGLPDFV